MCLLSSDHKLNLSSLTQIFKQFCFQELHTYRRQHALLQHPKVVEEAYWRFLTLSEFLSHLLFILVCEFLLVRHSFSIVPSVQSIQRGRFQEDSTFYSLTLSESYQAPYSLNLPNLNLLPLLSLKSTSQWSACQWIDHTQSHGWPQFSLHDMWLAISLARL